MSNCMIYIFLLFNVLRAVQSITSDPCESPRTNLITCLEVHFDIPLYIP